MTDPMTTAITTARLAEYRSLTSEMHQWAATVHQLVRERIALLDAAYGGFNHPTESRAQHAERVLAKGQVPFPVGQCVYDDLNSNRGYEHVEVEYGTPDDGGARITYTGWYPKWADDHMSYERLSAEIHAPSWLLTEPDGEDRFRDQTAAMVAAVRAERAREDQALEALLDRHCPPGEGPHQEGPGCPAYTGPRDRTPDWPEPNGGDINR